MQARRRHYRRTKPGLPLKHQIVSQTQSWDVRGPWRNLSRCFRSGAVGRSAPHTAQAPEGAKEITAKSNRAIAFSPRCLARISMWKRRKGVFFRPSGAWQPCLDASPIAYAMGYDLSPASRAVALSGPAIIQKHSRRSRCLTGAGADTRFLVSAIPKGLARFVRKRRH
jgi:hypothetical protein